MKKKRLLNFLNEKSNLLKSSYSFFVKENSYILFLILSSFFFGNLFNLFFKDLKNILIWEPLILFFILILLELINVIIYTIKRPFYYKKLLNSFKMGLLLGLFVDAFKVGS